MKDLYEGYAELTESGIKKENIFKKASKMVGNLRKPKYVFGKASPDFGDDEDIEIGGERYSDYPMIKDRKKNSKKPKSKRKVKKSKGCGCK
jgi:hypothetical protein